MATTDLVEKRKAIAGVFLSVLYGLAIQEMVAPVRAAFKSSHYGFGDFGIMLVFLLTAIRFFIGAQLYLWDNAVVKQDGKTWLFNFNVLITQGVMFVFLGGLCSRSASASSPSGFFGLLNWILVVDIVWILVGMSSALFRRGRPKVWNLVPWPWAALNTALVTLALVLTRFTGEYTDSFVAVMLGANVIVFMIDVWLVDRYGLIAGKA